MYGVVQRGKWNEREFSLVSYLSTELFGKVMCAGFFFFLLFILLVRLIGVSLATSFKPYFCSNSNELVRKLYRELRMHLPSSIFNLYVP